MDTENIDLVVDGVKVAYYWAPDKIWVPYKNQAAVLDTLEQRGVLGKKMTLLEFIKHKLSF